MAFSLRKMLSNIYYKKADDNYEEASDGTSMVAGDDAMPTGESSHITINATAETTEPDSTSKTCTTSLKIPNSLKLYGAQKGSLSDTDVLKISLESNNSKKETRKNRKLKLDIKKANKSTANGQGSSDSNNFENTPKHKLLDCKSSEIFSEKLKEFDFDKSFDLFDHMSEGRPSTPSEQYSDNGSLSDTDVSLIDSKKDTSPFKMCRKVEPVETDSSVEYEVVDHRPESLESFEDVVIDKKEEERISLLLSYQLKLEKFDKYLKQLLHEFQYHIEVSKVFQSRSIVAALPGNDITNIPNILGDLTSLDGKIRSGSPAGWNIVLEKEDILTKFKLRRQLQSMKDMLDEFVDVHLKSQDVKDYNKQARKKLCRSITYEIPKTRKRLHINKKKKRFNDYPDLKDALHNLFNLEPEYSEFNESMKCTCNCRHHQLSSPSQADSGVKEQDTSSHSITSSIGNFSLDSMTLSVYSECLDQIISYNSFEDDNLYNNVLQKTAIERITFYVQAHSIQLSLEEGEHNFEAKNVIVFFCPACKCEETEEYGILRHILSQSHCEKIHFLYKTAYIKKCFAAGKEIQPSTVLNPMTMYRDVNKIVCFGDAMYACSLCFENLIIGESVLMAHCSEVGHVNRREMLAELED